MRAVTRSDLKYFLPLGLEQLVDTHLSPPARSLAILGLEHQQRSHLRPAGCSAEALGIDEGGNGRKNTGLRNLFKLKICQRMAGNRGWAVLGNRIFMRRTPGGCVWRTGGRHDKCRAWTGTRIVPDGIVMDSGVIAQEA